MSIKQLQPQQSGAISLITVIILAIILSIITTGLLRLSIQDARSAIDDDLSNRAFFAAESGINDAVRYINYKEANNLANTTLNGADCGLPGYGFIGATEMELSPENPDGTLSNAFDISYTCQLIDLEPPTFEATATEATGTEVPLTYVDDEPTGVTIYWHELGAGGDGPVSGLRAPTDDTLLPADRTTPGDVWNAPAMLRVNLFSRPIAEPFQRDQLGNDVVFLKPSTASEAVRLSANESDADELAFDGEIINGECLTAGGIDGTNFACRAEIDIAGFDANLYTLRIKSLYSDAKFQVSFLTPGTTSFSETQALVDVTGRASDVYRRIQARVDLTGATAALLPDYTIQTAGDICKLITVDTGINNTCP